MKKLTLALVTLMISHCSLNADLLPFYSEPLVAEVEHFKSCIQSAVSKMIAVPYEEKSFENTLSPWLALKEEIGKSVITLQEIIQDDVSNEYANIFQNYLAYVQFHFFDNIELNQAVLSFILNGIQYDELSAFEREILNDVFCFCSARKKEMNKPSDFVFLCGEVEVSAKADTNGNSSVEVSVRTESEDGRARGEVSSSVERDSQGNTTGTIEARGTYSW